MPRQSGPKSTFRRKLFILNRMTALSRFCGTISKPFKSFQNRCARPVRAALECGPEATDQRDNSHVGQHATAHCPPALLAHPYTTFSNCGVGRGLRDPRLHVPNRQQIRLHLPCAQSLPEIRMLPAEMRGGAVDGNQIGSSGLAGVHTKVLFGDPSKAGLYSILLFVRAHTTMQAPSHRDDRMATVVSGTWDFV